MITFCEVEPNRPDAARIGNLAYGTPFIYNGSYHIKVDKRYQKLGQGLELKCPANCSVAMNMKLGTVRAIPGDTIVSVVDIRAEVTPGVAAKHLSVIEESEDEKFYRPTY